VPEEPTIVATPTVVSELAGVPDGTILSSEDGTGSEKIVYDLDLNSNVLGWHKEIV
jgi:hypothetical protein